MVGWRSRTSWFRTSYSIFNAFTVTRMCIWDNLSDSVDLSIKDMMLHSLHQLPHLSYKESATWRDAAVLIEDCVRVVPEIRSVTPRIISTFPSESFKTLLNRSGMGLTSCLYASSFMNCAKPVLLMSGLSMPQVIPVFRWMCSMWGPGSRWCWTTRSDIWHSL